MSLGARTHSYGYVSYCTAGSGSAEQLSELVVSRLESNAVPPLTDAQAQFPIKTTPVREARRPNGGGITYRLIDSNIP